MKVYLANNFESREWLKKEIVPLFEKEGIEVTSRWINIPLDQAESGHIDDRYMAQDDLVDVSLADVLVLFADFWHYKTLQDDEFGTYTKKHKTPGLGKFIEFGFAIGNDIPVIVINTGRKSVFFALEGVTIVKTVEECLDTLRKVIVENELRESDLHQRFQQQVVDAIDNA